MTWCSTGITFSYVHNEVSKLPALGIKLLGIKKAIAVYQKQKLA